MLSTGDGGEVLSRVAEGARNAREQITGVVNDVKADADSPAWKSERIASEHPRTNTPEGNKRVAGEMKKDADEREEELERLEMESAQQEQINDAAMANKEKPNKNCDPGESWAQGRGADQTTSTSSATRGGPDVTREVVEHVAPGTGVADKDDRKYEGGENESWELLRAVRNSVTGRVGYVGGMVAGAVDEALGDAVQSTTETMLKTGQRVAHTVEVVRGEKKWEGAEDEKEE